MTRLHIAQIEVSDWDEIIEGHFRAFADEPFQNLIHGENTPRNRQILKQQSLEKYSSASNTTWLKVIDTENKRKIVGVANYKLNPTYVPLQKPTLEADMAVWLDDPEDKRVAAAIFKDVVERKLRHVTEAHIQLDTLYVLPEYRGLGIASQLIDWGLHLASHLMVPIWIESSVMAHPLYLKHGFVDVEHSRVVMGKWDIEYYLMRWAPKATETEINIRN
ncbi:hypothetical protein AJ79_02081 [Helicocarpus griseus UAMH5409]|uniref:N-acetyltransferase domain-containing protein n=1 Tax=Helicocarpus griseus UAMH5409 TaxID=1447875 RepID=A0A2B7XVW8_9EURO|nr:hypothetical protein AJ79_02081 [Helicocarpus griseus UAMH5409]